MWFLGPIRRVIVFLTVAYIAPGRYVKVFLIGSVRLRRGVVEMRAMVDGVRSQIWDFIPVRSVGESH